MTEKTLKVQKIENGTVIDHISAGRGWEVIRLLGLDESPETVMLLSNVHSRRLGKKDVVKIENMELDRDDANKIALISPHASVNLIRGFELRDKHEIKLAKEIEGILACTNPACITHVEPVKTRFIVEKEEPLELRCAYCERMQRGIKFK